MSRPYFFAQVSTGTAAPSAAPTSTTDPDGRATAFKPVEGGTEMQSGEKLMVEAYAAFWLIAFVFILFSYRRQRSIDQRVADLEAAVAKARKDGAGES